MRRKVRERLSEHEAARRRAQAEADTATAEVGRLREAFDALPVGVIVRSETGAEVLRNAKAKSPVGDMQTDALIGRRVAALLDERAGERRREVFEMQGPPGYSVEITVDPLASGGVVAVVEDASERRRLESIRRDFAVNVSHELRTPVGALEVLVDAAAGEADPATVHRLVGRMAAEVGRARNLIEDLLDLSRIEAAAERPHVPVTAAKVVAAAVEREQALSERTGVRVEQGSVPDVEFPGDFDELVSAVGNLLDNALKYSDAGSSVVVSAATEDGRVRFTVRDHGVGVPAKDLDRIFERFYRVDRARDRRTGGSGLGLAIVRHVAENHGGAVVVESIEGVGSTFTLEVSPA
jgi:two-component system sensor histidine kinase SenX3